MLARPAALLTTFVLGAAAGAIVLSAATRPPPPAECPVVDVVERPPVPTPEMLPPVRSSETDDAARAEAEAASRAAQQEADARLARAEAAEADARRAVQRQAEARAASERQRAHEALQETALRLAGDVQAWTYKPVAFGGGAGSLAGLGFDDLGVQTDAQGRYQTVDGLFTLTVTGERATVRGTHRRFEDLTTTAVVEATDRGTSLVVDGRDYGGAQVR